MSLEEPKFGRPASIKDFLRLCSLSLFKNLSKAPEGGKRQKDLFHDQGK